MRLGREDMVARFLRSERTGFYLAVLQEGELTKGDLIELLAEDDHDVRVSDIVSLYNSDTKNRDLLRRVSELATLPASLRDHFRSRL